MRFYSYFLRVRKLSQLIVQKRVKDARAFNRQCFRRWLQLEVLESRQLLAAAVWHNVLQPLNVTGSPVSSVDPLDVLSIVNEINQPQFSDPQSGLLPLNLATNDPHPFFDVDCDSRVGPLDVLIVINAINRGEYEPDWVFSGSNQASVTCGRVTNEMCSPKLTEGDSLYTDLSQTVVIPDATSAIRVSFEAPSFDTQSLNSIRDAFEILLLDSSGSPITLPFGVNRDASFNWSESSDPVLGVGTHTDILPIGSVSTATFNVSGLAAGSQVQVKTRLVNNDSDTQTSVLIRHIDVIDSTEPAPTGMLIPTSSRTFLEPVDPNLLTDVTSSVLPTYGRTTLFDGNDILVTDLQLTNQGQQAISGRILLVIENLSDPAIGVMHPDGYLDGGRPYVVLTENASDGWLASGQSTSVHELRFKNPSREQFTYSLSVLAELNSAPTGFISTPLLQIQAGKSYESIAKATDPDNQLLTYTKITGPVGLTIDGSSGLMRWSSSTSDVGNHSVTIRASDPFGLYVEQSFIIAVLENLPNRPPIFTSTPPTDATIAAPFEVQTFKTGTNPVAVTSGNFGNGTSFVTANPGDATLGFLGSNRVSTPISVGEPNPADFKTSFVIPLTVDLGFSPGTYVNRDRDLNNMFTADVNGDGTPDLIVSVSTGGSYGGDYFNPSMVGHVGVRLGNGDGTFRQGWETTLPAVTNFGSAAFGLHYVDLTNDGINDIVATQYLGKTVLVYKGLAGGTFADTPITSTYGGSSSTMQTADFNADGKIDVVLFENKPSFQFRFGFSTLLGNGDGSFGPETFYASDNDHGGSGYVVDVDGKNGPDLVRVNIADQGLETRLNDGTGHFGSAIFSSTYAFGDNGGGPMGKFFDSPLTAYFGDFDGDGILDASVSMNSLGLFFLKGTGTGTFGDGTAAGNRFNTQAYAPTGVAFHPATYYNDGKPFDFNADGKLDVIIGDSNTADLSIGLGKGDGTFALSSYNVQFADDISPGYRGSQPTYQVNVADYNRDGVLDVAIGSASNGGRPGGVAIVLGDQIGTLRASHTVPFAGGGSGGGPSVVTDFTGDGIPDIALYDGQGIAVAIGLGDGTFAKFQVGLQGGGGGFHSLVAADFDGDGKMDLAWQGSTGLDPRPTYFQAFGLGNGFFQLAPSVFPPLPANAGRSTDAQEIVTGDFNGDGHPDLAYRVTDAQGSGDSDGGFFTRVDVLLYNPASKSFSLAPDSANILGPLNVIPAFYIDEALGFADLDGDGKGELFAHSAAVKGYTDRPDTPERLYVWKPKLNPTATDASQLFTRTVFDNPHLNGGERNTVVGFAVGDFNRDGKPDFAAAIAGATVVSYGNGDFTFSNPTTYLTNNRGVQTGDVNGDGILDLITSYNAFGNFSRRPLLNALLGQPDGTFGDPQPLSTAVGADPAGLVVGDFNLDGKTDFATYSTRDYEEVFLAAPPSLAAVQSADINGDGKLDLIGITTAFNRVKVLLGNGDSTFSRQSDLFVGASPVDLKLVDVDGDGKLDIVTANRIGQSVTVLHNNGGSYTRNDYALTARPSKVEVRDITGDSRPDIVAISQTGSQLNVLLNSATGLGTASALNLGFAPGGLALADVTGDGKPDAVISDPDNKRIFILPGQDDGGFGSAKTVSLSASPVDVAIADMNFDSKPDIIVTLPETDRVGVLFNRGSGRFTNPQAIKVGDRPNSLVVKDVNGDNKPDLMVTNRDNTLSVILNRFDPTNLYRYTPTAVDPDGDPITFDFDSAPGGMLYDDATGQVLWAPMPDQIGNNEVVLRASDNRGGSATQGYTISVTAPTTTPPPVFTSQPLTAIPIDAAYSYQPSATNPGDNPRRFSLVNGPDGLIVDPTTGAVSWDPRHDGLSLDFYRADQSRFVNRGNIQSPDNPILHSASVTGEGWFKFDGNAGFQSLIRKSIFTGFNGSVVSWSLDNVGGSLHLRVGNISTFFEVYAPTSLPTGQWLHLAFSFDGATNAFTLYVNGAVVMSGVSTLPISYDGNPLIVGQNLLGTVTGVRVWNRVLTTNEIQAGMNAEVPSDSPGLVLDYSFKGGPAAATVLDLSPFQNHGGISTEYDPYNYPQRVQALSFTGTHPVTLQVDDGKGGTGTQTLNIDIVSQQRGTISGTVIDSVTHTGLDGWTVYADTNHNSFLDPSESYATTNAQGQYTLTNLLATTISVAIEKRSGFTSPNLREVSVIAGQAITSNFDVIAASPGNIRGAVLIDANGNGIPQEDQSVYTSNFTSPGVDLSMWSNKTISTTPSGKKILGQFINDSVTLTVGSETNPLPLHESLTVSFDLNLIKGWYGNYAYGTGVEEWSIEANGEVLLRTNFSRFNGYPQSYPGLTGATNPPRTGASEIDSLGYAQDMTVPLTFTIPNHSSIATFTFRGLKLNNSDNPSWGLQNVRVTAKEPAAPAGIAVYLDSNGNKVRDTGETFSYTDSKGNYALSSLNAGSYTVRIDTPAGVNVVAPTNGSFSVNMPAGGTSIGNNFTFKATIEAASTPLFVSTPQSTVLARSQFRYAAVAVDPLGRPLTYTLLAGPDLMAIDARTGVIVWTPTAKDVVPTRVILKATNDAGRVVIQDFSLDILAPNTAPIVTSLSTVSAVVSIPLRFDLLAQDAEQTALNFSLVSAPSGMSIDPATGRISWTPTAIQAGIQTAVIRIHDGVGGETRQTIGFNVASANVNGMPVITSGPRSSGQVGRNFVGRVSAMDIDNNPLTFSLVQGPIGMTITDDGRLNWLPNSIQVGANPLRVRVEDGRGGSDEKDFSISIESLMTNRSPVLTHVDTALAVVDRIFAEDFSSSDADGDAVAYQLVSGPSGLSLDSTRGTLRWQPGHDQLGVHSVTVRVVDPFGGFDEQTFNIVARSVGGPPAILSVPPTTAAVGQTYIYSVQATDADVDPLTYSLSASPLGMNINPSTGVIAWTPDVTQVGLQSAIVRVTNGAGGFTTQSFSIRVTAGVLNQAPLTSTQPTLDAIVGVPYVYTLQATDPEGGAITYAVRRGPAGMSINGSSGVVTWTPTAADVGTAVVVLTASDPGGAVGLQSFLINVQASNNAPVIVSSAPAKISQGGLYRYDVIANDLDHEPLTYELVSGPAGLTLDSRGRARWQTALDTPLGSRTATFIVRDGRGGSAIQTINFNVVADTIPPRVSLIIQNGILFPWSTEPAIVKVSATDDVGVTNITLSLDGKLVALSPDGTASVFFGGLGRLEAIAYDAAGNRGRGIGQVKMRSGSEDGSNNGATTPTALITSLNDGDLVGGFVSIVGTASGVLPTDSVSYVLSYRRGEENSFHEISRGTSSVIAGVLGKWDTTLLENDEYVFKLEVTDEFNNFAAVERAVGVSGNFKLGNFRLSFADITIPVAGIPITLARTYDTLQSSHDGELGFGWSLEFRNANLRTGLAKTGLEDLGIYAAFKAGTKVYLTLPGGAREGFTFTPDIRALPGFGGQLVIATPRFTPDRGVKNALSVRGGTYIVNPSGELIGGGGQPYNPAAEEFGGGYKLTTPDGIAYRVDGNTGLLSTVTDRNNNTLTFSDGGISGSGVSLTFERDSKGRITKTIDPAGKSVKYSYDTASNLASVTDREGNITQYTYKSNPSHYLDKIIDPLGRTGIRTLYDANGRLVGTTSASGGTSTVSYDPANELVTTTDAMGRPITVVYDEHGNVLSSTDALGRTTQSTFDENNRALTRTDAAGNTLQFAYNAAGDLLSSTDPSGNVTRWTYDSRGALLSLTDPLGSTVQITRDSRGNVLTVTDPLGNVTAATYDERGLQMTNTDAAGNVSRFDYDTAGRLASTTAPDGSVATVTMDNAGNPTSASTTVTTATGTRTLTVLSGYNANGQVTSFTDAEGHTVTRSYAADGQVTSESGALGNTLSYRYDAAGNRIGTTRPDGSTITTEVNATGQTTQATLPGGQIVRSLYDAAGYPTMQINPDGSTLNFGYDSAGRPASQGGSAGLTATRTFDAQNRVTAVTDAAGNVSSATYDAAGRTTSSTDALGRTTQYAYDAGGHVVQVTQPNGGVTRFRYDSRSHVIAVTDALGQTTGYSYDVMNNLASVTDPTGATTHYAYNQVGRLLSETDANGRTTLYEYDGRGLQTAMISPLGGRMTSVYDAGGRLIRRTNADGQFVSYTYTPLGQYATKTLSDGEVLSYTYRPSGSIATVTDSRGVTQYEYDSNERLSRIVQPDGHFVTYHYNSNGQLLSLGMASGTTTYTPDVLGRLASLTDADGGVLSYTYDATSQVTRIDRPDGTSESSSYDSLGNVLHVFTQAGGTTLSDVTYEYDLLGRQTAMTEDGVARTTYGYDSAGRLLNEVRSPVAGTATTIQYAYDAVGNRTRMTTAAGVTNYTYDADNRLTATTGVTAAVYTYDASGRLILRDGGPTDRTAYTWSVENRLIKVVTTTAQGVTTTDKIYDNGGTLARETVNGVETRYLSTADSKLPAVVEEYTPTGTTLASYTYGRELESRKTTQGRLHYHTDGDGHVRYLTDGNHQIVANQDYTAYGVPTASSGVNQPYGYGAERYDAATGLLNLRARYYDPASGRFLSPDPYMGDVQSPVSRQKYQYAGDMPTNASDPTGMEEETLLGLAVSQTISNILKYGLLQALGSSVLIALKGIESWGGQNVSASIANAFAVAGLYTNVTPPDANGDQKITTMLTIAAGETFSTNGVSNWLKKSTAGLVPRTTLARALPTAIVGGFGIFNVKNANVVLSSETLLTPRIFGTGYGAGGAVIGAYIALNGDISSGVVGLFAIPNFVTDGIKKLGSGSIFNAGGSQVSLEGSSFGYSLINSQAELQFGASVSVSIGISAGFVVLADQTVQGFKQPDLFSNPFKTFGE